MFDLERMVQERDEMITKLKTMNAELSDRLTRSLDEQSQQRSSSLEHIVKEMSSRNEVLPSSVCATIRVVPNVGFQYSAECQIFNCSIQPNTNTNSC